MTPEVCIELHYPEALAFLQRHGPQAVAVVHDLVAHSHSDHGQLIVQASIRQITERLSSLSKDTVNRRIRALLLDGVLRRLVLEQTSRFEAPTYVLNLTGSGISRASSADPRSASARPLRLLPMNPSLSQPMTDECTADAGRCA